MRKQEKHERQARVNGSSKTLHIVIGDLRVLPLYYGFTVLVGFIFIRFPTSFIYCKLYPNIAIGTF
jgi:hypothetical protein